MPDGKVIAVLALCAIGYIYVGRPVAHGVEKVAHGVEKVVTLGHHPHKHAATAAEGK